MGALPLAFSVHHFVSSVGADAGFAAIIGLAILVLLFFAQARETTSLRHRAEELLGRIGELEARLARLASAQAAQAEAAAAAVPQVTPAPALRAVAGGAGSASIRLAALELPPFPPAGVGAPALTAATRVIPAGVAARAEVARVPVGVGAPAVAGAAAGGALAAGGDGVPPAPVAAAAAPPAAGPAPATAAAATNGASHASTAPVPHRAGGGPVQGQRPPAAARGGGSPGAAPRRAPARPGNALPPHLAIKPERSRWGRVALALLVVAVAAGAAAAVILLTQSKSPSSATGSTAGASSRTSRAGRGRAVTLINPATVTVSVVNGTTTFHLASKTANTLAAAGFRKGTVSTASDQTHPTTVVYYVPGRAVAAQAVARKLGLTSGAIRPIDQATRQVAFYSDCTAPPCLADVVVLLGADLAR